MNNPPATAALNAITPLFEAHCATKHLPGCAFGIVADGKLAASRGLGVVNPTAPTAPTADTIYRIASMTKSFAALAILMLRDEGPLRLDTAAAEYVPELHELTYPTRDSAPITVRQLLTMSGGWPEDNPWGDRQLWRDNTWLGETLRSGVAFANAPGITFEYSNLGYMVLGRMIANVSGAGALDFITRRILHPLGMHDTGWNAEDVDPARLAYGYRWLDGGWMPEPMLPSGGDGAVFGALYSTVGDMARWIALMVSAWPPRDDPDDGIACRATLRELQQPSRLYTPSTVPPPLGSPVVWSAGGYGFGLRTNYEGVVTTVAHSGGLPGFGSHMCWLPDHGVGIVALGNVRNANMGEVATAAVQALVQGGHTRACAIRPAPALEAARKDVEQLLRGWDGELAERLFADNFFLDDSAEWRQAQMAELVARHGELRAGGPLVPENALRGSWKLLGDRGSVTVFLTLTPTISPRVQELTFTSLLLPGPTLQTALDALIALINRPSRRGADKLFASQANWSPGQHTFFDKICIVAAVCGQCQQGKVLEGDGERAVRLLIEGPKGAVEAALALCAHGQRFAQAEFRQVR
jgi:CubicO group peptidase (beta-lactamase class C family)